MAQAGNLSIKVALELAEMRKDIARVSSDLEKATSKWSNDIQKFGTTAKGVFTGAFAADAAMRVLTSVSAAITQTIEDVNNMANAAKRASVDFQSWQVIEQVAAGVNISVESMAKGVDELNKTLGQINAGGGKKAAEALDRIGLSASELQKMKVSDRLRAVVDALNKVGDPADRAAIGAQIFRKAYNDLIPVVQEGGAAFDKAAEDMKKFGLAITDEAAGGITEFKNATDLLKKSVSAALANAIAPFLSALTPLIKYLAESTKNTGLLAAAMTPLIITFKGVVSAIIAVGGAFKALSEIVSGVAQIVGIGIGKIATDVGTLRDLFTGEIGLGEALDRFKSNASKAMADTVTTIKDSVRDAGGELARAGAAIKDVIVATPTALAAIPEAFTPLEPVLAKVKDKAEKAAKAVKDVKTESEKLQEQLAQAQRELEVAQARAAGATEAELRALTVKGEAYADIKLQILETKAATDAYNDAARQAKEDADAFTDATNEWLVAQRRANGESEETILRWRAIAEGWSDARLQAELLKVKIEEINEAEKKRKETQEETKQFWTDFGNLAGQALADIATGTKSASEAMKAFVIQLAAAVIQAQLLKLLGLGSGVPNLGGVRAARGAWFGPGGVSHFAQGGVFHSPTRFAYGGGRTGVLGEAGPEAIMPLTKVGGRLGVSATPGKVEVHNYGAVVDVQQDHDRTKIIVKAVRDQLAGDILRGGNPFSTALERTYPGVRR